MRIVLAGSYTLEAAILFPIIIGLIAFLLQIAISGYAEVEQCTQDTEIVWQMDTKKYFYNVDMLKSLKEQVSQHGY